VAKGGSFFERLRGLIARDKEAYWKSRAINAVNEVQWELLYGDDGAPDRVRLSDEQYDDVAPGNNEPGIGYNPITPERVLALGDRIGYEALAQAVRDKIAMQDLYWQGGKRAETRATELWLHRRDDLPDWFWWYHGYSSGG
jgi:hypothetical protein